MRDAIANSDSLNNTENTSRYIWEIIPNFRGDGTIAIWLRPRFEDVRNWRFFYPANAKHLDWGIGKPQKTDFVGNKNSIIEGNAPMILESKKFDMLYVGCADMITSSYGCYIVFTEPLPSFVVFTAADAPNILTNGTYEIIKLSP